MVWKLYHNKIVTKNEWPGEEGLGRACPGQIGDLWTLDSLSTGLVLGSMLSCLEWRQPWFRRTPGVTGHLLTSLNCPFTKWWHEKQSLFKIQLCWSGPALLSCSLRAVCYVPHRCAARLAKEDMWKGRKTKTLLPYSCVYITCQGRSRRERKRDIEDWWLFHIFLIPQVPSYVE